MSKGWEYVDVMHKDRRVARIFENGSCKVYYPSFMPYNLYLEKNDDIDGRVLNLSNFYYWCASRVLTLDRKYAKEILNSIGAIQSVTDKERAMIAISYRAVSLLDVFWVRMKNDKKTYSEISLFRHSLSDAFVDVCLRGKNLTLENSELIRTFDQAADIGTPGVAPKAWIKEGNCFYLLKDGDKRDVDAELLASKIAECFEFDAVRYSGSSFKGTKVSKCAIITSEETSIVPFEYISVYCANKEKNEYDFVFKKDAYSYFMMNIVDYLVGNTDRHWGNWGFYVDNSNNKVVKLHPLMDFNKAFLSYDTVDGAVCQTAERRMSQKDAAVYAVKTIGLKLKKDVEKEWFSDTKTCEMFFRRLDILKNEI